MISTPRCVEVLHDGEFFESEVRMFKVRDEATGEAFTVYHVRVNILGETEFLIYGHYNFGGGWKYVNAIYFKPYEEDK